MWHNNCQNDGKTGPNMTKTVSYLLFLLVLFNSMNLSARPRVGVVLSGGGAKGTAHIGALRVLEEAGVPIDIIVGTSMGSIVGGLYAIGFTPDELDSLFMAQDWNILLRDRESPKKQLLSQKKENSQYIFSVPFFQKPQDIISGGVIRGRNIGSMLWSTTEGYHDSIDFRKLPIPFACISQDLVTGEEMVMQSGVLPLAIRASMSLPAVFAPVSINGRLLIDGGLVNNYPVDIARQMGADIIIGVDVQNPLKSEKELQNDVIGQMGQLIALQSQDRWKENVKQTDIYIKVNVDGYNSASFSTVAIDTLIERGRIAAEAFSDTLRVIAGTLKAQPKTRPRPGFFGTASDETPGQKKSLDILVGDKPKNSINLGLRFDNEELAALLFNSQMIYGKTHRHHISLTARLGNKAYGRLDYNYHMGRLWNMFAGYQIMYNDFNIYEKGDRICEVSFVNHQAVLGIQRSWKTASLKLGGEFQDYNYSSFLYRIENRGGEDMEKEAYAKFGGEYSASNLDDNVFPTKGQDFRAGYYYVIPVSSSDKMFHVANIHWTAAFSFNSRFTVMPRIDSRYLTSSNTVAEMNTLGGQEYGKYFKQQIPFYGINHFEESYRTLLIAGIEVRQRIGSKHYVSGAFNLGLTSDDWKHFFRNSFGGDESLGYNLIGGAIKYDLKTFIGPIGFSLHFSNRQRVSAYVRAGFNF